MAGATPGTRSTSGDTDDRGSGAPRWVCVAGGWRSGSTPLATESAIEHVTGTATLVDSSKLSTVLWTASRLPGPLAVVHLVRDPRAVTFS